MEEENSTDTHNVIAEHKSTTQFNVGIVASLSHADVKVSATTAEAIANFKPTHRQVISGIAPHVFDERKRRRSQRRTSSSSRTYWCGPSGEKRPSPLRWTTVCAAREEHSVYLDQPDPQHRSTETIKTNPICAFKSGVPNVRLGRTDHNNNTTNDTIVEKIDSAKNLKTEALWKYLRFDAHIFKSRSKKPGLIANDVST